MDREAGGLGLRRISRLLSPPAPCTATNALGSGRRPGCVVLRMRHSWRLSVRSCRPRTPSTSGRPTASHTNRPKRPPSDQLGDPSWLLPYNGLGGCYFWSTAFRRHDKREPPHLVAFSAYITVDNPLGIWHYFVCVANLSRHDPGPSRVWDGYGVAARGSQLRGGRPFSVIRSGWSSEKARETAVSRNIQRVLRP